MGMQGQEPEVGGQEQVADGGQQLPETSPDDSSSGIDIGKESDRIGQELFTKKEKSQANADDGQTSQENSRQRDASGRFVKKPAEGEVTEGGQVTPGPEAPVTEVPPEGQQTVQPASAPKTWRKEAAALFNNLPPLVQAEILKRETDMHKGLAQYRTNAMVGQSFEQALQRFVPLLHQHRINPVDMVQRMTTAHFNLLLSPPEVKVQVASSLLKDYGINPMDLLDAPIESPEVAQMRTEMQTLRDTMGAMQQRHFEQVQAQVRTDVDSFADDPANIYFDELADDIAGLIRQGVARNLREAYEKAIWLNPTVRAKELARLSSQKQAQATAAAAQHASRAKIATAANVVSRDHPNTTAAEPTGSMDDTLANTLAAIRKRKG